MHYSDNDLHCQCNRSERASLDFSLPITTDNPRRPALRYCLNPPLGAGRSICVRLTRLTQADTLKVGPR